MKKLRNLLLALTAVASYTNTGSAQAVEQGNVIIDGYYGFPNLYTAVFKSAYANSGTEIGLKIGGIGPTGGRVEYMVADKIGLGLDVGFNNTVIEYQEEDIFTTDLYDYKFSTQKLGVMLTFNYHFISNADKLDAYFMVGAGYGSRSFSFESSDPNYVEASVSSLIPVAARVGLGMRYFFIENVGINVALGFGQGGLVNGGLSFKF